MCYEKPESWRSGLLITVYGRGLSYIFLTLVKRSEIVPKPSSDLLPLHLDALSFSAQEQVGFLCFVFKVASL